MPTFDEFCNQLVERYLNEALQSDCNIDQQLAYYRTLSIREAILHSVNRGHFVLNGIDYYSDHFNHFAEASLQRARDILLRSEMDFRQPDCADFLALYRIVRTRIHGNVEGLADLFCYDTALRIGSSYDISLSPDHIFLQRGARLGAEYLGLDLHALPVDQPYLPKNRFVQLSRAFERLAPYQIENLLCIYYQAIKEFMNAQ